MKDLLELAELLEKTAKALREAHQALLSAPSLQRTPLEDLGLSVRTENCLGNHGIRTVEDLTNLTIRDLLEIRNLGTTCLKEIEDNLQKKGLYLKEGRRTRQPHE